jgi:Zn-dependent protease
VLIGDPVALLIGSIFLIPAIAIAVPVHEIGHGLAAVLMGDPSARNQGFGLSRPRSLFNVYGIVAAFLANVTWGSPVRVNEYRLTGTGRKLAYVLGGPAANLVVAAVCAALIRALAVLGGYPNPFTFRQPPIGYVATIVYAIYFLNLATFAFQLLPVPGLDGWRVVETLFRSRNPRFFFNVAANTQTIWGIALVVVFVAGFLLRVSVVSLAVAIFFQPVSNVIYGHCTAYVALYPCLR